MDKAELYMRRCLDLAILGSGYTAPNPMVGAVLVYENRIIGEGYHQQYGREHAEVNCLRSVKPEDEYLIPQSELYVSLEPCAHFGKTPPCADLIIGKRIPSVIIGCRDPFPAVNGKGIEKLKMAGVAIRLGVLERECLELNRRFFMFHTLHRPYIILKWAQSADLKIDSSDRSGMSISNAYTNRLVHKWRAEEASILVGTRTALTDNPALSTRFWPGPDPVRLVIDRDLKLPATLQLFDNRIRTLVFNRHRQEEKGNTWYCRLSGGGSLLQQLLPALYELKILSVLVEGGAHLLQSFITENCWDEARVITNEELSIGDGISAPFLNGAENSGMERIFSDSIRYFKNEKTH